MFSTNLVGKVSRFSVIPKPFPQRLRLTSWTHINCQNLTLFYSKSRPRRFSDSSGDCLMEYISCKLRDYTHRYIIHRQRLVNMNRGDTKEGVLCSNMRKATPRMIAAGAKSSFLLHSSRLWSQKFTRRRRTTEETCFSFSVYATIGKKTIHMGEGWVRFCGISGRLSLSLSPQTRLFGVRKRILSLAVAFLATPQTVCSGRRQGHPLQGRPLPETPTCPWP